MEFVIGWIITGVLVILVAIMAVINMRQKRKTKKVLEDYLSRAKERIDDRAVLFNNEDLEQLMQLNSRSQPLLAELWLDEETHEELLE